MKFLKNILLSIVTFILFLIFLEFVALKYFIPTTDVARVEHEEGVTHYKALQKGVVRLANEYSAPFLSQSMKMGGIRTTINIFKKETIKPESQSLAILTSRLWNRVIKRDSQCFGTTVRTRPFRGVWIRYRSGASCSISTYV